MTKRLALVIVLTLAGGSTLAAAAPQTVLVAPTIQTVAEMPQKWNGTLLLYSRGYSPRPGGARVAPESVRQALLDAGYALTATDYGAGGWALAEAVPAQSAAIDTFIAQHGKPRRVIAWGDSMGGLVTTALAEAKPTKIDGAIAMCASIGGALGMMNMALDGAFAFKTLLAPDSSIRLVGIADDRANGAAASEALKAAMATPQGRARVALAGVLGGLPDWSRPDQPRPAPGDDNAMVDEMAASFVAGIFLPRGDQEQRAGVGYSWNSGVDYAAQLEKSGRRPMVERLYKAAGLSLDKDLQRLKAAPRIAADKRAVDYMERHYTPNARPTVPLVAVQKIGDGMTSPSMQRGYAEAAGPRNVANLWLNEAGHCRFSPETVLASLRHLETRLDSGRWPAKPAGFVDHTPAPMLRPCVRGKACG